jgi:hypothetical protein
MIALLKTLFRLIPASVQASIRNLIKARDRRRYTRTKQQAVKYYRQKYNHKIFIETGTFQGDMVEAQKENFEQLFSIELSEDLWRYSASRFSHFNKIKILHGDSGTVLNQITKDLEQPAIFWLDGHYSEGITAKGETECPIFGEIDAIFRFKKLNHVILVDDARCFTGVGDWPTVEEVTSYVQKYDRAYKVEVLSDIIRYTK